MQIQSVLSEGIFIVTLSGRLDSRTTPEFMRSSAAWPAEPTVIDLASLEYLNSAGLRALLQLKRDFSRNNIPFVLAGSAGLVEKVLRMSGFEQIFVLYPALPEALNALTQGSA
jgi:anti-sigma B factor antagonist